MPATYEPIATTTLGSATNSITFSSISSAYTDLRLVMVGLGTGSASAPMVRFNSDSGTNYSYTILQGDGSTATSIRGTSTTFVPLIYGEGLFETTIPRLGIMDIFSYAGSTNKTILNQESSDRNGNGRVLRAVGLWRNTAAITSITITDNSSRNFGTGTTATLYGILKA